MQTGESRWPLRTGRLISGLAVAFLIFDSVLLTHILFPIYVAALLWGGAILRDARLRALLPWGDGSRS